MVFGSEEKRSGMRTPHPVSTMKVQSSANATAEEANAWVETLECFSWICPIVSDQKILWIFDWNGSSWWHMSPVSLCVLIFCHSRKHLNRTKTKSNPWSQQKRVLHSNEVKATNYLPVCSVTFMLLGVIFTDSFFYNLCILLPISAGMQQICYKINQISSSVGPLLSYFIFCYV